jgi:hypothetical protein
MDGDTSTNSEVAKRLTKEEYLNEFLRINSDLQTSHNNGLTIWFDSEELTDDEISSSVRGYITLNLQINSTTTLEEIHEAWPLISQWRKRLQAYQPDFGEILKQYFLKHRTTGYSYKQIADAINEEIARYIRTAYQTKQRDVNHSINTPILCAAGLMSLMGIGSNDVQDWLHIALENLIKARPIFPPNSPVDAEQVRGRLRNWPRAIRPNQGIVALANDWQAKPASE